MAKVGITDILNLLGEGGLEDRFEERKRRFRNFLQQSKWQPDDFELWIHECLEMGSFSRPAYFYAFQDLVVTIGLHLGMRVEYGRYSRGQEIGYDGKWVASGERTILLEVKTSPWPVPSVHQLGSYMNRYVPRYGISPENVYGLFIVGPGDHTPLVDQIKGSEYRSRMKMAEVDDLLRLWRLKRDLEKRAGAEAAARMVQNLLLPFESINVGAVVGLIEEVTRHSVSRDERDSEDFQWKRSELREFLSTATSSQRALLAALCTLRTEPANGQRLVELMQKASHFCEDVLPESSISLRTFAGALSSLHRACHQRDKEPFIERTPEGYRLAKRYLDWIVEWAVEEGLVIPAASEQGISTAVPDKAGNTPKDLTGEEAR